MKKSGPPVMVQQHYDQMVNTIKLLEEIKFATLSIIPKITETKRNHFEISWDNQIYNEGVNAKNFSTVDSYERILLNRSFQVLLFDNSIIRCSLRFSDDVLQAQNFSWIPCPLSIDSYETSIALEPELITDEIIEENFEKRRLLMRSTVRIDYDGSNDTPEHPSSHIHLQNPETRINTSNPLCFNTFLKHIILTYYPKSYYLKKKIIPEEVFDVMDIDNWSGLAFKTMKKSKHKVQYISQEEYILEHLPMG